MKKRWDVVLKILATIISLVVGYNNLYIISDLSFNYGSLKDIFYFSFIIFIVFNISKTIPEFIIDLSDEVLIPRTKEKISTKKGKFEFALGIVGTGFVLHKFILDILERGLSLSTLFQDIFVLLAVTVLFYNIFSNLNALFIILFLIFSMIFVLDLLGIGTTKEELIKAVMVFPFVFGLSIFLSFKFEKFTNYIFGIKSTEENQEDLV